jgi:hypothetical protein
METGRPQPDEDLVPAFTAGHNDWTHGFQLETPTTLPSINIQPFSSDQGLGRVHTHEYYVNSSGLESAFPGIRAFLNLPIGHQVFALQYHPPRCLPQAYISSPNPPGQNLPSTLPPQMVPFPTHASTPPFSPQEHLCHITYRSQPVTALINASILKGFFMSTDRVWTAYRRNYFCIEASFTIEHLLSGDYTASDFRIAHKLGEKSILGFGLNLRAKKQNSKPIELIQHTSKRDKGPSLPVLQCAVVPHGLSASNTTDTAM